MINRFIKYSIEKNKKIKAVMLIDEKLVQKNILICSYDDIGFKYICKKNEQEKFLEHKNLLAASYTRGDEEAK